MAEEQNPETRVGQTLGKKFSVRRLLGVGGMGVVYEAEHLLTKRLGALKLLRGAYATTTHIVERFVREASAAGRIGNPHIVECFDAGELPSGEHYIFMELLAGKPVSSLIREGRLPLATALHIAIQAADGLAAAHAAGIVHRDIKPDNLFACASDPIFIKIVDFGISKFNVEVPELRLTTDGPPLGTPQYMSPEQVVGKRDIDARTDIYALGAVLYECVTSKPLFEAESLAGLGAAISSGIYQSASSLAPDLPAHFDAVLARALRTNPNDRYPSMQAFAHELLKLQRAVSTPFDEIRPSETEKLRAASLPESIYTPKAKQRNLVWGSLLFLVLCGVALTLALRHLRDGSEHSATTQLPKASATRAVPKLVPDARAPATPPPTTAAVTSAPRPPEGSVPQSSTPKTSSTMPTSRAAKDGLTESNPFAD